MVKKVRKKYEKSCDGLPSSPKSKRGGQAFGILAISTAPILEDFGGHFHVMCAQLRPMGTTTWLAASADGQLDQLRPSRSIDRRCRLD